MAPVLYSRWVDDGREVSKERKDLAHDDRAEQRRKQVHQALAVALGRAPHGAEHFVNVSPAEPAVASGDLADHHGRPHFLLHERRRRRHPGHVEVGEQLMLVVPTGTSASGGIGTSVIA